jgi:hypothetical protein
MFTHIEYNIIFFRAWAFHCVFGMKIQNGFFSTTIIYFKKGTAFLLLFFVSIILSKTTPRLI